MEKLRLIPLVLFSAFVCKIIALGNSNLNDSAIIAVLGFVTFCYEYHLHSKKIKDAEARFLEIEKLAQYSVKLSEETKSAVSGLKLASNMKSLGSR